MLLLPKFGLDLGEKLLGERRGIARIGPGRQKRSRRRRKLLLRWDRVKRMAV
jgi:hypothetical protein